MKPSVHHARFDASGRRVTGSEGFLADGVDALEGYLSSFASLNGDGTCPNEAERFAERLKSVGGVVSAISSAGDAWAISSFVDAASELSIVATCTGRAADPAMAHQPQPRRILADALNGLDQGCAMFDEDGRLVVCNDRFSELNAPVREFISPGVYFETLLREMTRRRLIRQALGREGTWIEQILGIADADGTFEIERVDGQTTTVSIRATSQGGFIVSEMDITAQRKAERSAKSSEQMLSTILQASPANLCMSQIGDGEIIYQSPSCAALFGPIGSAREQFADPLERADFLTELLASATVDDFQGRARRHDGSLFPALFSARLIDYRGEEVMVSSVTDLTEQRAAERRIKDAGVRLNDAIEALSEGFILYDADERVVMSNQRFREMNEPYAHKIKPGTHTRDLLQAAVDHEHFVDADDWLDDYEAEHARGESGSHRAFEFKMTDGTWINSIRRPTRDGGFVITWLDVTDQKHAILAQQIANDRMRDAIDSIDESFALYDADDRLVLWNDKYAELNPQVSEMFYVGVSHSELLHAVINSKAAPDATGQAMRHSLETRDFRTPGRTEFEHHDGRWFSMARNPTTEGGFVITRLDITEQKRAASELLRLNDRLRDAIESVDHGFALYDSQDRLVIWNKRYEDLNAPIAHVVREGVTYQEILETAIASHVLDSEEAEIVRRSGSRANGNVSFQFEFKGKNGRWYSVSRNPTSENGFVITRADITERKLAEARERESYALPARVLSACPVALVMSDAKTAQNTYRNSEDIALFGERRSPEAFWADQDQRSKFLDRIQQSGSVDEMQVSMVRESGETFPALMSGRTVEFQDEAYFVTCTFDLSDRIAMERELSRQQEMLHQSEKLSALGELLAGVAHELNNPLSVVVGHALMMDEEIDDPVLRKRVGKISAAAERCSRIVKTFLAMARQRPTKLEQTSINSVVQTAVDVAGYGLRSVGGNIVLDLDPTLPPVIGDADQLAQVLANLIVNAEHAMQGMDAEGLVTISTRLSRDHRHVVMDVIDNGPGIPEKVRARIFEPFFTTKTIGEGTGIGLAFCHRVIDTHNGQIAVHEAEGGGAHFSIRLEAAQQSDTVVKTLTQPEQSKGKVLVIDDE
ncbi:MAG: PAS-domain containing protein [Paracoccaceae bacterium]